MRIRFFIYLIIPLLLIISLYILSSYVFNFPAIKEHIVSEKKTMLKELTRVAINTIETTYNLNKDSLSEAEIKQLALEQIRNLNYGNDQKSYFWISDLGSTMIMHPYRKDLEGKNLSFSKDIHGTLISNEIIDIAQENGEGFLQYYWQWQDDSTKILPKITFVKLYKNWDWIVGTGIYIDDIEIELSKLRKNELQITLLISVLMLLLIFSILYYGIKSEKQRIKSQEKLQFSEEKFRNIFRDNTEFIIITSLKGTIIDVNKKAVTSYGEQYEKLIGKKVAELIPEKYHKNLQERLKLIQVEDIEPLEIELKLKNDSTAIVEIKSSLSSYENNKVIISTLRNITTRKINEKKLIESRLQYKIVADYTSAWEYWLNPEGEYIYISPSCKRISGYEPEEFKSDPNLFTNIIIPEDRENLMKHHKAVLENRSENELIEFKIIHKKGHAVWIEHTCQQVYNSDNANIGIRGSNHDVTFRKTVNRMLTESYKKLELSEEKFKTLSDVTFEGILIHESGIALDVNRSFLEMYGYRKEEVIGKKILDLTFDEENKKIVANNIKNNYSESYEVISTKKDGSKLPIEIEGKTYYTEYLGKTVRAVSVRDISARKKAETEIKKLSTAVEQSANLVIITDTKGIIEYANHKFYKTTGYSKKEIIGNSPAILNSGKQDKNFYRELWETINSGRVWQGEICNKKKNGEIFWVSTSVSPVYNENNEIINFMSVDEDITEKKLSEVKLFNTIIETEEKERKRFAEDLHDELGPHLSGIRLYINELEDENINAKRRNEIVSMLDLMVKEAIEKTRTISNQLMPSILTDYGLIKALKSFCSRISATNTINILLNCNKCEFTFNKTTEIVIYRVIIELINNTIKHAKAQNIVINFSMKNDVIILVYKDDGQGFDLEKMLQQKKGLGLNNIINRMKTIESSYRFESNPRKGIIFNFVFSPNKI